jgi:NAD(P)-dependent dehydrogenase (short-subunit alcohol dehydrogenase family)
MSGRLQGRVAVITGSSLGIGKACAQLFAEEGASVVINDCEASSDLALDVVKGIIDKGGRACFFKADVRKKDELQNLVKRAVTQYGRLDILVNNAFCGRSDALVEQDEDEWESVYLSTIKAIFLASKVAIPEMIKVGKGAIINLSSEHGLLAARHYLAYATFKGAVLNMTRQMAADYGKYNIRVNAMCPGRIVTERKVDFLNANPEEYRRQKCLYPLGRPGTLREIATAALFLASDDSSFVSGHALVVDGGITAQLQDSLAEPLEKGISEELAVLGVKWP